MLMTLTAEWLVFLMFATLAYAEPPFWRGDITKNECKTAINVTVLCPDPLALTRQVTVNVQDHTARQVEIKVFEFPKGMASSEVRRSIRHYLWQKQYLLETLTDSVTTR